MLNVNTAAVHAYARHSRISFQLHKVTHKIMLRFLHSHAIFMPKGDLRVALGAEAHTPFKKLLISIY